MSSVTHLSSWQSGSFARGLRALRERLALRHVPSLACATGSLRPSSAAELATTLSRIDLRQEWLKIEADLARACPIEDGRTGGVNPGDRRALWYLIRSLGVRSVLEIGTHVGASTVYLAAALRANAAHDLSVRPRLVTVDVREVNSPTDGYWRTYGLRSSPEQMLEKIEARDFVRFATACSLTYLESCEERFDLVFLDGDHHAAVVYQELPRAFAVLDSPGVVLLHDYFPRNRPLWRDGLSIPGPYLAMKRLKRERAPLDVLPLGELPWATKQGSRRTSLALVISNDQHTS